MEPETKICFLDKRKVAGDDELTCLICHDQVLTATVIIGLFLCDCSVVVLESCVHNYCSSSPYVLCPVCREPCKALECLRTKDSNNAVIVRKELVPSGVASTEDDPVFRPESTHADIVPLLPLAPLDAEPPPSPVHDEDDDSDESYSASDSSSASSASESSWTSHESNASAVAAIAGKRKRS